MARRSKQNKIPLCAFKGEKTKIQRRQSFALKVKFNVSPARQEKKAETVSGAGKSGNIFQFQFQSESLLSDAAVIFLFPLRPRQRQPGSNQGARYKINK